MKDTIEQIIRQAKARDARVADEDARHMAAAGLRTVETLAPAVRLHFAWFAVHKGLLAAAATLSANGFSAVVGYDAADAIRITARERSIVIRHRFGAEGIAARRDDDRSVEYAWTPPDGLDTEDGLRPWAEKEIVLVVIRYLVDGVPPDGPRLRSVP